MSKPAIVYLFKDGSHNIENPDNHPIIIRDYDVDEECHSEGDKCEDGIILKDEEGDLYAEYAFCKKVSETP